MVNMSLLHSAPADSAALSRVREAFADAYGHAPHGVYSAPGRVNIIGEHVDYQAGLCLPMAISHRCFVAASRREDSLLRMRSLQSDEVVEVEISTLAPGSVGGWAAYVAGVVWALGRLEEGADAGRAKRLTGMDILVDGYVPLGAGLSSSAALECAVAAAADDLCAVGTTPHERITACIAAENDFAGANTGGLDQSASILCTEGHALLLDCRDFSTAEVPWDLAGERLALLIVDTRAAHSLVGGEYAERRAQTEEAARLAGVATLRDVPAGGRDAALASIEDPVVHRRARHVIDEIERVRAFTSLLAKGGVRENLGELGALLNVSHDSLRDDFEVTVPELDVAVDAARGAGAHGARMTGGGFGGSIIALVDEDAVENVAEAVAGAFEREGFAAPQFFIASPSRGAGKE